MTAEIFRRHGVFFGEVHKRGEGRMGYNEHPRLKELARGFRPDCYKDIIEGRDPELKIGNFAGRWFDMLDDDGWDGLSHWGVKVDAFCYSLFEQFDPVFVGLHREPDAIVDSCMRAMPGRFTQEEWEKIVKTHHDRMADLGLPLINTDRLVEGDFSMIELVLDELDLGFVEQIVNEVIDGRS